MRTPAPELSFERGRESVGGVKLIQRVVELALRRQGIGRWIEART
jgi:hypothetical protein